MGLTLESFLLDASAVLVLGCSLLVAPAVLVLVCFLLVASALEPSARRRQSGCEHSGDAAHAGEGTDQIVSVASETFHYGNLDSSSPLVSRTFLYGKL